MGTYSHYFIKKFLLNLIWVFTAIQVFAALCILLDLLTRFPYISLFSLLAGIPDQVVIYLPRSLPISLVIAGVLFINDVRRQQGFLWISMAGHDPRRYQLGILGLGALMSLFLYWLNVQIIPKMWYASTNPVLSKNDPVSSLSLLLALKPTFIKGYFVEFESADAKGLKNMSMVSTRGENTSVVTADSATPQFNAEESLLKLDMRNGRFLSFDNGGRLLFNSSFDSFIVSFDADKLFSSPKTKIISLDNYTNSELKLLPRLAQFRQDRGLPLTGGQNKRLSGIQQVMAIRVQLAITPFMILLVIVLFLGAHVDETLPIKTITVIAFCLILIIPQQIVLEEKAKLGDLRNTWFAFLPSIEIIIMLLIWILSATILKRRP